MSDGRNTVTLGNGDGQETYEVQPQPYPRLFRQLSEFGQELQELGELDATDAAALVAVLGGRIHEFLRIFIPNLMAEHRFAGYATRRAMEARELDEQAEAKAPDLPQIIDAVEVAFEVNGGKRLGGLLGKLLGPEMGRQAQRLVAAALSERLAQGSTSSPSTPDGAPPGGSTTASPTPDGVATPTGLSVPGPVSAGSPSLVSSPS